MKPSERVNGNYELGQEDVTLHLPSGPATVPVQVRLELSPRPQVALHCELTWSEVALANEMNEVGEVIVELPTGVTTEAIVADRSAIGGGKISNDLFLRSEPATVLESGAPIAKAKFLLVNFPSVWGSDDLMRYPDPNDKSRGFIYPRFQLRSGKWRVQIIAVDSLMGMHHRMLTSGGSALTHVCVVTQQDNQTASVQELEEFLSLLHLFFSFARGSHCGLTLLRGYAAGSPQGKRVWEQWGSYKVEPWRRNLQSWFDQLQSHTLSGTFDGIRRLLTQAANPTLLWQVFHWYLRSNESREPEVSVVLNHAALERLAFAAIGTRSGGENEGDWMAQALQWQGVDPGVPSLCPELGRLQSVHSLAHGPHALVAIRNELVHPGARLGVLPSMALDEARSLGLYYIELMLLSMSGYTGRFVNRLVRGRNYHLQRQTVPWVSGL